MYESCFWVSNARPDDSNSGLEKARSSTILPETFLARQAAQRQNVKTGSLRCSAALAGDWPLRNDISRAIVLASVLCHTCHSAAVAPHPDQRVAFAQLPLVLLPQLVLEIAKRAVAKTTAWQPTARDVGVCQFDREGTGATRSPMKLRLRDIYRCPLTILGGVVPPGCCWAMFVADGRTRGARETLSVRPPG